MARYGMDYRSRWNGGGMGHDYSERGYTGSSWSGNRDLDRDDWHRNDRDRGNPNRGGGLGMHGNRWERGDRGDEGSWGGYEGDFGGRGTYERGQAGEGWDHGSMGGYSSGYGRSGFRGGSGEWEREGRYAGRGEHGDLPWGISRGGERFDRWNAGEGLRGGPRGRGMEMDDERDLGDRVRDGWNSLRRGARDMLGGGRRGYDRGW